MRYLVQSQENSVAKNGNPFLKLKLMNAEENITAYYWSNVKYDYSDKVCLIEGKRGTLGDNPIITIETIIIDQDQSRQGVMPTTSFSIPTLIEQWDQLRNRVTTPEYMNLLDLIRNNQQLWNLYTTKPAATNHHHNFLGGLLTHSVGVAQMAQKMWQQYQYLDESLIITGALLHDIGKTQTYTDDLNITEDYVLADHIAIGYSLVRDLYRQANQKDDWKLKLLGHIILSHHNKLEWRFTNSTGMSRSIPSIIC